jgi:hypothetical protein
MIHNFIGSLIATSVFFLYEILFYSEQAVDWYRLIFIFCFLLILSNYFKFDKSAPNR